MVLVLAEGVRRGSKQAHSWIFDSFEAAIAPPTPPPIPPPTRNAVNATTIIVGEPECPFSPATRLLMALLRRGQDRSLSEGVE